MKVITVASGKVPPSKQEDFESGYRLVKEETLPPGLERSFLLKSADSSGLYLIETIWSSREELDAMRSSTKPRAIVLFEGVGVTPTVAIYEVRDSVP